MAVKIFFDGADRDSMIAAHSNPSIQGFTTNPTILRKAGVTKYKDFARDILSIIPDKPVSFEVFSDDYNEMISQGMEIASWGDNVYVKIPIMHTSGMSTAPVIDTLTGNGVKVNVTAIMTTAQVESVYWTLKDGPPSYISIFAGRMADTGVNPVPLIRYAVNRVYGSNIEIIWASPREVFNVVQASEIDCHIITCTPDIIRKLSLIGKDLNEYSLDTVKMFYEDGKGICFR